jgi:hypothetical protein
MGERVGPHIQQNPITMCAEEGVCVQTRHMHTHAHPFITIIGRLGRGETRGTEMRKRFCHFMEAVKGIKEEGQKHRYCVCLDNWISKLSAPIVQGGMFETNLWEVHGDC